MSSRNRDISPPNNPIIEWGGSLPISWRTCDDGSVSILPESRFLSRHGNSLVMWDACNFHGRAFAAYHVAYPDGGVGIVLRQTSDMGMVPRESKPWRRLLESGAEWWPGKLTILKDHLEFEDLPELLPIWIPDEKKRMQMQKSELGVDPLVDEIHWIELYIALAKHEGFMHRVRHDDFAVSTFMYIRDEDIRRVSDGKIVRMGSDRRGGDMLGAWRRCGETYLDFYPFPNWGKPNEEKYFPELDQFLQEVGYATRTAG